MKVRYKKKLVFESKRNILVSFTLCSSEDFLKQGTGKNVSWRLKVEYCLKSEEEKDDIVNAPAVHFKEDVHKIFACNYSTTFMKIRL